ncbi:MAG: hypothetical protein AABX00_01030 [Nanoarchaeota archaeon]
MKKFTLRSRIYAILALIGIAFSVYAGMVVNKILFGVSVLFVLVSIDNVFCGLSKKKK